MPGIHLGYLEYNRLLQDRKRLKELEKREFLKEAAKQLTENIGTILANTPYNKWPDMAKVSLEPLPVTLKELYKSSLPEDETDSLYN